MASTKEFPSGEICPIPVRSPRQSRLLKAALTCDRLGRFDVTLRNVSQTGIGGSGAHILTPGEHVMIDLPGHDPMRGTVRWVMNTRFGIEADHPISIDNLRAAYHGRLKPLDDTDEFRIIPPPKVDVRRPGLSIGTASPPGHGRSEWMEN